MTEVSGDPFAKKSKVKVNGGTKVAASDVQSVDYSKTPHPDDVERREAAETPRDETCKTLYGSDVKTFLADYREAIEERKDLKEFRRIAETLLIATEEFCKALYPRDFVKRKA